jgi:hypothetical protein
VFGKTLIARDSGRHSARFANRRSRCIGTGYSAPPLNFQLPADFQIPPADQQCILSGQRLNLKCIIANDPDFKRIRAEEAMLEAQALAAAKSGKLDPYNQVETLGQA